MIVSLISTEILSYTALHVVLKQFRWYKSWTENNSAGSPQKNIAMITPAKVMSGSTG